MITRRRFLQAGLGAGLAVRSSPLHPAVFAQDEARPAGRAKARAVIWLWMGGGMSQIDSWDSKPGSKSQGELKAIDTAVPGIQVSELLPVCASQMKRLAIVRSMSHPMGNHAGASYLMHTGMPMGTGYEVPSIGTILSYELGRKDVILPRFVVIDPPDIPLSTVFGEDHLPFRADLRGIPNSTRSVDEARDRDRAALLAGQNVEWEAAHLHGAVERYRKAWLKADDLVNSTMTRAFDVSEEPAALRTEFGGRFGLNCLLARRLVQAGCAFIEIGFGGWDTRADNFNALKRMAPTLDKGLGTQIGRAHV